MRGYAIPCGHVPDVEFMSMTEHVEYLYNRYFFHDPDNPFISKNRSSMPLPPCCVLGFSINQNDFSQYLYSNTTRYYFYYERRNSQRCLPDTASLRLMLLLYHRTGRLRTSKPQILHLLPLFQHTVVLVRRGQEMGRKGARQRLYLCSWQACICQKCWKGALGMGCDLHEQEGDAVLQ